MIPTELSDLANGDEARMVWLALAQRHYETSDRDTELAVTGIALKMIGAGTAGQQIGAWHELTEAVNMWHRWDLVADSQGRHSHLSIPSREAVQNHVIWALDDICRLAKAAA